MKYLLGYLEGIPDAPNLSDPGFQQLLHDVQAGKSQAKASETFYENLEKILNELKSTPDSGAFHKPVSKREAPNYYEIITKPMDFTTMLRNVKAQRYKTKADFSADLDLIWDNCLLYNTQDNHPLRAQARLMKQKADHHLTFLAERTEKPSTFVGSISSRRVSTGTATPAVAQPTAVGGATEARPAGGAEEDAAGESDDATGEQDFQEGANKATGTGTTEQVQAHEDGQAASQLPGSLAGRERRDTSVLTNGHRPNVQASSSRQSPPPFRPKLQTSLDNAPALTRTPHSTTHFHPFSLNQPGPSFSDKGKAKEVLNSYTPPSWYLPGDDEESKLEGSWWTYVAKDENYTAALPAVPQMLPPSGRPAKRRRAPAAAPRLRLKDRDRRATPESSSTTLVDHDHSNSPKSLPSLVHPKPVNLTNVVHRSADHLADIRKSVAKIHDFQKAENEGYLIPPPKPHVEREERRVAKQEWNERKRRRKEDRAEARKRARQGGEVGEREAAFSVRQATAGMLAQAGFEGSTDVALDFMSRVVADRISNMGRTIRLLIDGFSHKMSSEEMVLHALYENGGLAPGDIESHVKDEIQREETKVAEMSRRMRQAYKEVTTAPIIEDDMMFADNGEMLLDGNFADELGEDFLGLRNLGVAQEHGMQSLTIPSSVFYGRRKRQHDLAAAGQKEEGPEYPPPSPFIPLLNTTYQTQLPALFHAFFAARLEGGLGFSDDGFDATHSQIGPLGQIIVKNPPAPKKKPEVVKKAKPVKVIVPGPGKGNWIRPPKEERDRKAAEKKAMMGKPNGHGNGVANGNASEEDAEGEEE